MTTSCAKCAHRDCSPTTGFCPHFGQTWLIGAAVPRNDGSVEIIVCEHYQAAAELSGPVFHTTSYHNPHALTRESCLVVEGIRA